MMKWWKKFFKTAGRIWWRWDVRFCAVPTGRSIQQQSMESPGMCRSLIRELITFDLVKQTEDIARELTPRSKRNSLAGGVLLFRAVRCLQRPARDHCRPVQPLRTDN